MKILYIGGMKSGKSKLAEENMLDLSPGIKPYYLATTEIMDDEMSQRVEKHQLQRKQRFETIEEPLKLYESIKELKRPVLVECLSIWINNMLHYNHSESDIYEEIQNVIHLHNDMVFVLNDVGSGIVPDNELARQFIDISGRISQIVAEECDEVYFCIAGLKRKMK